MSLVTRHPSGWLARLAWLPALLTLVALLALFAFRSGSVLFFPHQVEYGEGPVLDWVQQATRGTLPYKPIQPFPWNFSVYAPGYLVASAGLTWALPVTPWFGGRLLSLASGLGLALLLYIAIRSHSRWAAIMAAALWLASPYLFRWATFYRPDLFALAWSALGLLLTQRAVERGGRGWLAWAALCFVASFWTKQSFFAAPLAAALWLGRAKRAWLPRLLLWGILGGAALGAALAAQMGGALFANLIAANANPFSWQALWQLERSFFKLTPVLVALALLGAWQTTPRRVSPHPPVTSSPFALYAALSLLVSLSVGKAGAWENYFLEPLWVLCLLAGRGLAWMAEAGGWRAVAAPALVLLQLGLFIPGFERRSLAAETAWLAEERAANQAVHRALAALPADALVWSEQMGALAEAGRPVALHSFVYTQLERQGLWNPQPLTDRLATGEGALLIQRWDAIADPLRRDRWSRSMLDAGERGHALGTRAGDWLLRPPLPFPAPDAAQPFEGGVSLLNWMAVEEQAAAGCGGSTLPGGCRAPAPTPSELAAGERLEVHLLWRNEGEAQPALTVSIQLFAPDGERVVQDDRAIRRGELGGAWPVGALARDEHTLALPATLPPGDYTLLVALYESETLEGRGSVTFSGLKVSP